MIPRKVLPEHLVWHSCVVSRGHRANPWYQDTAAGYLHYWDWSQGILRRGKKGCIGFALDTITHHHGPIRFTYHPNGGGDYDSYMSALLFILTVLGNQSIKARWPGVCARTTYTQVVTFPFVFDVPSCLRSRSQAAFSYPEALVWISPPPNQPKNAMVSFDHIHLVFFKNRYADWSETDFRDWICFGISIVKVSGHRMTQT